MMIQLIFTLLLDDSFFGVNIFVCFRVLDVALAAVLVPVLVMLLTTLILILVCAWHWRNRLVQDQFI